MPDDNRDAPIPGATCDQPAAFRYTWPGRDEAVVCARHAEGLRRVAAAMELHLQLIPASDGACSQRVGR